MLDIKRLILIEQMMAIRSRIKSHSSYVWKCWSRSRFSKRLLCRSGTRYLACNNYFAMDDCSCSCGKIRSDDCVWICLQPLFSAYDVCVRVCECVCICACICVLVQVVLFGMFSNGYHSDEDFRYQMTTFVIQWRSFSCTSPY